MSIFIAVFQKINFMNAPEPVEGQQEGKMLDGRKRDADNYDSICNMTHPLRTECGNHFSPADRRNRGAKNRFCPLSHSACLSE